MNEREAGQAGPTEPSGNATPFPSERIGTLVREYPELASFTADATLLEIKVRYGLSSFREVRELGRRRAELGVKTANRHPATSDSRRAEERPGAQAAPSSGR